ncbi:MAG TPA: AAA family ATPase, partial [Phycisphaerae bacterium]|nr:AAA family ATPase [Phycisphaerae bacterium]
DWAALEAEIEELKEKIRRLGNVNLDAIAEQEELEKRATFLASQRDDLRQSRKQLEELIEQLNNECRERFVQTFETVRGHFQELFRRLFGGGKADIMLEQPPEGQPLDVLEAGIDIMARPPGKENRNITLLSGGEKTMTAIALLLAIFRSRPSPFTVLDEVDAALDEANNERFNRIICDFLDHSQFLIITHSKRTMTIADVLYGVTMQEAGVSKRVGVRFDTEDDKEAAVA